MSQPDWSALLLSSGAGAASWQAIFEGVEDLARTASDAGEVDRELGRADYLLSEAAWDLWRDYAESAPSAAHFITDWWSAPSGAAGRAILLLDAMSVRELAPLLSAASSRGVETSLVSVRGAPVPTDTQAMAKAIGLSQRSQLKNSGYPAGFFGAAEKPYTDVCDDSDFATIAQDLPPRPHVFLWHPGLDELMHQVGGQTTAFDRLTGHALRLFNNDGFWALLQRLRQGRSVLIASDHGWTRSQLFGAAPVPAAERLRSHFGAKRCVDGDPGTIERPTGEPLSLMRDGRAAVVGPFKWTVPGGFPHVSHGGLTLGEVCIPIVEFQPL